MKIMNTLVSTSLLLSLAPTANAWDVYGKDNLFIKVTLNTDRMSAAFEICKYNDLAHCRPLGLADRFGNARYYRISDLTKQQKEEQTQITWTVVGDLAVGAATILTGGVAGYAFGVAGAATDAAIIYGTLGGAVAGGATSIVGSQFIDFLNPVEQFRQSRISKQDVITDQKVTVNENVKTYARSLNTVLNKLNPVE